MGHLGRNADDITGGKFLANAALNGGRSLLVRGNGLGAHENAADDQSGGAGLHKKDVDLSFVPFGLAVGLSASEQEEVVGKICKLLRGKVVRISRGILGESLDETLDRCRGPVLESFWRGTLGQSSE